MQGDGPHVIKELRIHRPAPILLPDGPAHERGAAFGHRLAQGEPLPARDAVAEPLVGHAALIGGLGGRGKPALVNAAAMGAIGVGVVRVQLDAQAGLEEGARNPIRREAQQAAALLQGGFRQGFHVPADHSKRGDSFHKEVAMC